MPVKLPRIERVGVVAPEAEAKIDVNVPTAPGLIKPLEAVSRGVLQVGEAYEKLQIQREDTATDELANKWINERSRELEGYETRDENGNVTGFVEGVRHLDGDPSEPYVKFDDGLETTRENLIAEAQISDRAKVLLEKKLNAGYNSLYRKSLLYRGQQYNNHENKVTQASIELEKRKGRDAIALMGVKDQSKTTSVFAKSLNNISNIRIKKALKFQGGGSAKESADGDHLFYDEITKQTIKVKLDKTTELAIAKDQSDMVNNAVSSLLTSDTIDHAEKMLKAYSDYIDPVNEAKLTEKIDKVKVKTEGAMKFAEIEHLPFDEQERKLDQLPAGTARQIEIKEDALNRLDLNKRRKNRVRNIRNDQAAEKLYQIVSDRMASSEPYENTYQMQNDPMVAGLWSKLSKATSKKMLNGLVDVNERKKKKKSPLKDLIKMDNLLLDNQFFGMPPAKFYDLAANLNSRDFNRFQRHWDRVNNEPEFRTFARDEKVSREINRQWLANGLVRKYYGRETTASQREREQLKTQFMEENADSITGQTTSRELSKMVGNWITGYVLRKEEADKGPLDRALEGIGNIFGKPKEQAAPVLPTEKESRIVPAPSASAIKYQGRKRFGQFSPKEQLDMKRAFKQANPNNANPTARELMNWYHRNN